MDGCCHCGEPIGPGDERYDFARGPSAHLECAIRMLFGSLGHQQRACPCYGGHREDPPGLTTRRAAQAALAYFMAQQTNPVRN
jgi:hypothetical protein